MPPELRQRLNTAAPEIVAAVIAAAQSGDMAAARLVLERIAPVTRSTAPPVSIPDLVRADTLAEKAQAIIAAVAHGRCPPDIGATLIQSVGSVAKIIEIDEIERRLTALEERTQ